MEYRCTEVFEVDPRLDLYMLIYPSFIFPLVDVSKDRIVKRWGVCKGLAIYKDGAKLIVEHKDAFCINYAKEILGLWSIPYITSVTNGKGVELVKVLINRYGWFGIATSSLDDVELFSAIFLSQNTDFHVNVVRWLQRCFKLYGSVEKILNIDEDRLAKDIGTSYQVLKLAQALKVYLSYRDRILKSDAEEAKRYLLQIKGVGPKICNAYILYVKKNTLYAPIDKNLIDFLSKFDSTLDIVADLPRKNMCLKYYCNMCPRKARCTYYIFRERFKELSGWMQTMAYVHNKLFCRHRLCKSCSLKFLCRVGSRVSS